MKELLLNILCCCVKKMTAKTVILFKECSEAYETIFKDNGYMPIFIQTLQFEFTNLKKLTEKLCDSDDYDGLILTSPRAIEAVSLSNNQTNNISQWMNRSIYTVGENSAEKIKELLSLNALGADTGNATKLADLILNRHSKSSKSEIKFLFPCGNLKSDTLPTKLASANISVDALTVYVTNENVKLHEELCLYLSDSVETFAFVFFSPSGVQYVFNNLKRIVNKLPNVLYIAFGSSTAAKIEGLGVHVNAVASEPTACGVLEALRRAGGAR